MHSDLSRISSYVAMFASHRVITVVSSGANYEAKLCAVEEKLTPKPCIEVSYFWIKDFKVRDLVVLIVFMAVRVLYF